VKQSAVLVHEISPGDSRLTGVVVAANGTNASSADLRTFLLAELPDYMVPSSFHFLETIPLTPNGKIDRKALPKLLSSVPEEGKSIVPPRNDTERKLALIWSKLLAVDAISIKDDFFDLGGHSLLAVRLFAELERQFGKRLPLKTLFQAPTLEQLAQVVQNGGSTVHWSSLAAIKEQGSKAPLFLVHGAEGNVLLYRALARHLSKDHPVYGLQSRGLSGKEDFYETFEDMAAHYVKEIRRVRAEGPYYLGGYCLGGAIALEIARQLEGEGEQVALVAMFETYNAKAVSPVPSSWLALCRLLQNVRYHCANLMLIPSLNRREFLSEKWNVASERLRIRLDAWAHPSRQDQRSGEGNSYAHLVAKKINDRALNRYCPQPYSGRVVLFRPRKYFRGLDDLEFGWGDILGPGLEVHQLPFYPKAMLVEPFVRVLASELNRCLNGITQRAAIQAP
jgi:thioesterase domain-containing protein/acyl carrier protein